MQELRLGLDRTPTRLQQALREGFAHVREDDDTVRAGLTITPNLHPVMADDPYLTPNA